jgi:hypothetical protein
MRDPVLIKHQILKRMNLQGDIQDYHYFHENGPDPGKASFITSPLI